MSLIKRQLSSKQIGIRGGAYGSVSGSVFGDKELLKVMSHMRETAARRTMTAGAAKAAQLLAKKVKAEVPARFKDARRGIGWRRLKATEAPGGGAKVGAKVGRTRKKAKREKQKDRGKRKGVGIGPANIHWLFNDATHNARHTKSPIRYTGVMLSKTSGIPSVTAIGLRNASALRDEFRKGGAKQLTKEIAKGKAF